MAYKVTIYTDGAARGNPGPGGYGIVLISGKHRREISEGYRLTTNNRMELMAVIEGLKTLTRPSRVRVVTDSRYVYQGITTWIYGWLKKNWLNSQKKPVLNRDLWEELLRVAKPHQIDWQWIKGHSQHPENERCDFLARHAIRENLKR